MRNSPDARARSGLRRRRSRCLNQSDMQGTYVESFCSYAITWICVHVQTLPYQLLLAPCPQAKHTWQIGSPLAFVGAAARYGLSCIKAMRARHLATWFRSSSAFSPKKLSPSSKARKNTDSVSQRPACSSRSTHQTARSTSPCGP